VRHAARCLLLLLTEVWQADTAALYVAAAAIVPAQRHQLTATAAALRVGWTTMFISETLF